MHRSAVISECGKHRLMLERIWMNSRPKALFIMHNPSKADAVHDDHTVSKLIRMCQKWGYGGFFVGNIFSYRATNPKELKYVAPEDLVHPKSMEHIKAALNRSEIGILAYGNISVAPKIVESIQIGLELDKRVWANWYCLAKTKSGNPRHPLYLPETSVPTPYGHNIPWEAPDPVIAAQTQLKM